MLEISKEQFCAFCLCSVVNWLSIMSGMGNINLKKIGLL